MKKIFVLIALLLTFNLYAQQSEDLSLDEFITEEELNEQPKSAWELWDELEANTNALQQQVKDLIESSNIMEEELVTLSLEISQLKQNLSEYRTALLSNRDDTGHLVILLGEAQTDLIQLKEKIAYIKSRQKNQSVLINVLIPTLSSIPVIIGGIEMANDNVDRGWNYIKTGIVCFVGAEVIYQGGKWIFRVW